MVSIVMELLTFISSSATSLGLRCDAAKQPSGHSYHLESLERMRRTERMDDPKRFSGAWVA